MQADDPAVKHCPVEALYHQRLGRVLVFEEGNLRSGRRIRGGAHRPRLALYHSWKPIRLRLQNMRRNGPVQRNAHMFQPHKAALERGSVLRRHANLLLETAERNPQRFRAVVRMARKRPESLGQVDFANLFETVIGNRRTISVRRLDRNGSGALPPHLFQKR